MKIIKNLILLSRALRAPAGQLYGAIKCRICGRNCDATGSGMAINGMCERCYENGGDDE
jgi:hypothetical protein